MSSGIGKTQQAVLDALADAEQDEDGDVVGMVVERRQIAADQPESRGVV